MQSTVLSIVSTFASLEAEGAQPDRVGVVAALTMHSIHSALAPIVGDQGVSALYRRSLFLISPNAEWAQKLYAENNAAGNYASLKSALSLQSTGHAVRDARALFETIYQVLVSLIGKALTERLLHPIYSTPSSGQAAQENQR